MLVDKGRPSSWAGQAWPALAIVLLLATMVPVSGINLSADEARRIGHRIWQNECNGTIAGLTSWNAGEDFASLGIGHFIWYPPGRRGPFDESFPKMVAFARDHDAAVPDWLQNARACPWTSRADFERALQSSQMNELRRFLAATIDMQTQFLVERVQFALPKMIAQAVPEKRSDVQDQFHRVSASPHGCYALIDYVNFKGEGVLPTERYQGQGWGLLQVLETMQPNEQDPVKEFARAAATVLKKRVANSPPERHEGRWLVGWLNRVNGYNR
jgi:hypothetical protein